MILFLDIKKMDPNVAGIIIVISFIYFNHPKMTLAFKQIYY